MFKSKKKIILPGDENKKKNYSKPKSFEKKEPEPYDEKRLWSYCIWLLSRKDYTAYELTNKMKKHQPDIDVIEKVINKLKEYNYVNDERRATSIAKSYLNKEAPAKLKQRLSMKGVDRDLINTVIEETSSPELELETAIKLLHRKFKFFDKENFSKYSSHLSSRGFSWHIISKAIDDFKSSSSSEDSTYTEEFE